MTMFASLIDSSPTPSKRMMRRILVSGGSIALHGSVLLGLVAASYFYMEPLAQPRVSLPFIWTVLPPPAAAASAPAPPGSAKSKADPVEPAEPADEEIPETGQPQEVPEDLPEAEDDEGGQDVMGEAGGIPGGGPGGVPGGKPGGIAGGSPDGFIDGIFSGFPDGVLRDLPGENQPLLLTGDVRPPERTTFVKPEYPKVAREARAEGKVVLQVVVGKTGDVEEVRVLKSNPLFDQAAVEAVKLWRYRPALQAGRPVKVYMTIVVEFMLK